MQVLFNLLIPDHNADVFNPPFDESKNNILDTVVNIILGGFVRWDGVYFLHIAEYGYIYENSLAFFPLFPWSVRVLANSVLFPLQFVMQYRTVLVVSGFVLNLCVYLKCSVVLFRLSKNTLKSEFLAYQSIIMFCINPASIFMSAFYSETLFAYLSFSAMLMFEERKKGYVLLYSSLSSLTRSNGLLTAGFELHRTFQTIIHTLFYKQYEYMCRCIAVLTELLKLLLYMLLFLLPFVLYQIYISDLFCNKNISWKIPDFLIHYGQQRGYHLINDTSIIWCINKLTLSYSHIQSSHWNVGFLKYYEIKQIPNFILAIPVSVLSVSSILYYFRQNMRTCLTLGLIPDNDLKEKKRHGFRSRNLLPYMACLLFITIFGWLFIHIQVLTRMVFSSSPVLYWYTAEVISSDEMYKPEKSIDETKQLKSVQDNKLDIIYKILHFKSQNIETKCIIVYFLSYFVIGALMFCNFLPWT